jgi:predicted ribosomally synthesized peptide with nif11-like leader
MSEEAVSRFLEMAESNEEVQRELSAALDREQGAVQAVLAVARKHGCEFTADQYLAALNNEAGDQEMGDAELEAVAGGRFSFNQFKSNSFSLFSRFRSGPSIGTFGGGGQQEEEEELIQA